MAAKQTINEITKRMFQCNLSYLFQIKLYFCNNLDKLLEFKAVHRGTSIPFFKQKTVKIWEVYTLEF